MGRRVFLFATALAVAGCSSASEDRAEQGASSVAARPDQVQFDVKWKPGTVLVDADAARDAWLRDESDPSAGRYVFRDGDAFASVKEGSVVLLPAIGLFEIASVAREGGKVTLDVAPASLLDAASEGSLSWSVDTTARGGLVALQGDAPGAVGTRSLRPLGGAPSDAIDMHLSGGGYEMGVKMSRTHAGDREALAFEIVGGVEEEHKGAVAKVRAELKGHVAFRSEGAFEFHDDQVTRFDFIVRDVELEAEGFVELDSLTVRGELVDYPARAIVPFAVGPLPMYYAFGAAVDLTGTVGTGQSVRATGRVTYAGDLGFQGNGLTVSKVTKTGKPTFSGELSEDVRAEMTAIATLAAPRIELGMGVPQLGRLGASAGVFLDMRASMAANLEVSQSGGPCLEALGALGAYYGGEAKLFGLSLGTETPIVKFSEMTARRGSCTD